MASLQVTVNGQTQILQLGTLSAAVNAQITQAVANSAASATQAAASATTATNEASAASTSAAQAAAYVAELPSLVVQQSATFAALPPSPLGLFLVLADETKGGSPTIYLFTASHRYWVAMVQDA
jgi:hypothetical protein